MQVFAINPRRFGYTHPCQLHCFDIPVRDPNASMSNEKLLRTDVIA
jgi:hypothetical protein